MAMNATGASGDDYNRAQEFTNWNSEENGNRFLAGEQVDDFKMFDFQASSYSKDLKGFAEEYIDLYDADKDGQWNSDEFYEMATDGANIPEELEAEAKEMFKSLMGNLNLDGDAENITAEEFAAELFAGDLDLEKFAETDGSLVDSLDGKVNFYQYNANADPTDPNHSYIQDLKADFFKHFYGDNNKN